MPAKAFCQSLTRVWHTEFAGKRAPTIELLIAERDSQHSDQSVGTINLASAKGLGAQADKLQLPVTIGSDTIANNSC